MADMILRGGEIIDGTGAPGYQADLVIDKGKIIAIEEASQIRAALEINANGKVVCPGFIDIHNHSDFPLLINRFAESGIRQGITTAVTGNCGHGPAPAPIKKWAEQTTIGFNASWGEEITWKTFAGYLDVLFSSGISINVAPLVPHGTIRLAVMGFEARTATGKEIDSMKSLVAEAMSAGAAGFSTGLEYSPGQHADEDEIVALSEVAAKHGRFYASHIRNRGDAFKAAVREALNISRRAGLPAQLSHLAPRPYADEGVFDEVLDMIYTARDKENLEIGIDTFPDTWGPGMVVTLLPPRVYEGPHEEVLKRLHDPATVEKCRAYIENPTNYLLRLGGLENFYLTYSKSYPELVEKNFKEIAEIFGIDYTETIFKLLLADGKEFYTVLLRHIYARQQDLDKLLLQPICSLESDGIFAAPYGLLQNFVMNRSSYGYTIRFIQEYALERKLLTLEDAIRKMTALPAAGARLDNRGKLLPGMAADVVILDLDSL
ncbi:MAG: amidohydrolase family protein, partial [bacterium]